MMYFNSMICQNCSTLCTMKYIYIRNGQNWSLDTIFTITNLGQKSKSKSWDIDWTFKGLSRLFWLLLLSGRGQEHRFNPPNSGDDNDSDNNDSDKLWHLVRMLVSLAWQVNVFYSSINLIQMYLCWSCVM